MNVNNVAKSIDSLAPLSDAIINIQELFNDGQEDLDINKLISLIQTDVILSVNILKMANSPLYGFSNKIASVSQAVTLFGIMQIYGFIMSYAISENIKAKTEFYGLSNERFNDICNLQSALLIQWYSKIDLDKARFLAPLALIMETGKLVISNEVETSDYKNEFLLGVKNSKDVRVYEKELLDETSYNFSAMVFQHWHLEPAYARILNSLDKKDILSEMIQSSTEILNVVITAVNVKSILTKASVLKGCELIKKMQLPQDDFIQVAIKVKKAYVKELEQRELNKC